MLNQNDLIKKVNYISGYQYGMRDSYKSVINYIDSNNNGRWDKAEDFISKA